MSSANEAHWSMSDPRFSRLTLQGKTENNVNNLRAERESRGPVAEARSCSAGSENNRTISPPSAPFATKRRRYMAFMDEDGEEGAEAEDIEAGNRRARRRLVKKLGDDFDRVAMENERTDLSETGNEGGNGKLTSYGCAATVAVAEEVNNSTCEGEKAKAGKNSKIQGNKNTVSGTILAKRDSN